MNRLNSLSKRIAQVEQRVNPPLKALIVIVAESDTSCEAAKNRIMKERGLSILPPECTVVMLNICGKPAV